MTPLAALPRLSQELRIELRVKRDDLYPYLLGGSKARKLVSIVARLERRGCDAVLTTGGLQSNHACATALLAASKGWPCQLVLHGEAGLPSEPAGNLQVMLLAGARIEVVPPSQIGAALAAARQSLLERGRRAATIPGGGHCLAGAAAYADAAEEALRQCEPEGWMPDFVVHASGTGGTQAGLLAGFERAARPVRVLGISVARRNPRGSQVVTRCYSWLRRYLRLDGASRPVEFRDEWTAGGYEVVSPEVVSAIQWAAAREGLIADPTYTGKALAGLRALVRDGEIWSGARVLFWHTGGLLNLVSKQMW